MSFVHLHVHSEYSLLDGFSNIKKLVKRAKEMDMPAVALTDHGTMFGVIDFYKAATEAGVKPIIGVESYMASRTMSGRDPQQDKKSSHLLLLAENQTGYHNLLKIASAAQLEGFYYYPRIDHDFLAAHAEGLICTSGCMSAEVPRLIQQGRAEEAQKQLDWYYEVFGPERFFLELQSHDIPELESINKNLVDLGRRYDAKFVATNDVHYINQADARLQDVMLAIQTGCLVSDPNRMRMSGNSYYLRSPQEMAALFSGVPDALNNTLLIAERCNVDLGFKGYHLPEFDVPEGYTVQSYLRELCEAGLLRRYGTRATDAVVRERLDYELGVIHNMGFDAYFLIVWDLCRHARAEGIWYNARGSAAGSMVGYTLDITLVDPIEHGLIFERFLNPGRISMPDIDLDFRDDRRAEMIQYTANKYGDDKVAQIITFGTLGARAAIRDVGRVLDVPLFEVDRVAKLVPNIPGKPVTIAEALEEIVEFKQVYQSSQQMKDLIDTAAQVEGVVRNAGTHAAGVIITDRPVGEYIPLHRPTGASAEDSPVKTVTQFEMSVVDSLGLLKVDFLGLDTLTIMARACDLIRERHGIDFNLNNIPVDDPGTYELMGRGETAGVFQVEGAGMRRWLLQMKPKELANVVAMVALFRPGPMDFIPGYIKRMHGEEPTDYKHPELEPIFKETYGYPVYQEQLMFAAMRLASYTAPEADDLRKAISKKMKDKLLKHREKFVKGCKARGIDGKVADEIFADWEEFARYGFNKSHAVDYGVIAVQTAFLKLHYPVEYMTAVLSARKNDATKVAWYVADCRRMGIEVERPDINASQWDFSIEDRPEGKPAIRFGLGAVKNVGQAPVEALLKARADGPFADLNDLARRVDMRQVGKRSLECMVKVGALDRFGPRPALLEVLDRLISVSSTHFKAAAAGQMSMFSAETGIVEEIRLPKVTGEFTRREVLNWERELIGLYLSDHPLSTVMEELNLAVSHFSAQLAEVNNEERVRVAGLITKMRHHQSKAGKPMGFATIEDVQGNIELVIFPKTWAKFSDLVVLDKIVLVEGRVDAGGGADPKILVDTISTSFSSTTSIDPQRPVLNGAGFGDAGAPQAGKLAVQDVGHASGLSQSASGTRAPQDVGHASGLSQSASGTRAPQDVGHASGLSQSASGTDVRQASGLPVTASGTRAPQPATVHEQSGPYEPAFEEPPEWDESWSGEAPPPPEPPDDWNDWEEPALPGPVRAPQPVGHASGLSPSASETRAPQPVGHASGLSPSASETRAPQPVGHASGLPDSQAGKLAVQDVGQGSALPQTASGTLAVQEDRKLKLAAQDVGQGSVLPQSASGTRAPQEGLPDSQAGKLAVQDVGLGAPSRLPVVTPGVLAQVSGEGDGPVQMITVMFRSTGDKVRDILRLRRIHGILTSYPGDDRYAFLIFERERGYRIEFPSSTCGHGSELIDRLGRLAGPENVVVEPIILQ